MNLWIVTGIPPKQYRERGGKLEPFYWAFSEDKSKEQVKECKACGWTKVTAALYAPTPNGSVGTP